MSGARIWCWRLLVGATAMLFASLMLFSYLGIPRYALLENQEATYRGYEADSLAAGDLTGAQEWKEMADLENWRNFEGRFGVAACLSSLAVFVAAVLVKRRSSRPSVTRAATFLTRSMFLGFLLSVVALVALYAAVIAFVFLWED